MKLKIEGLNAPEETKLELAGLDIPGDITQPCRSLAEWIAHTLNSNTVEISHFLTAVLVIAGDWIEKYWGDHDACVSYLNRHQLPSNSREVLLELAWSWDLGDVKFDPRTKQFSKIIYREKPRPVQSEKLNMLIAEATTRAKSGGLPYPKIEHVLLSLVENPEYEEQTPLQGSQMDVIMLMKNIENREWTIPPPK